MKWDHKSDKSESPSIRRRPKYTLSTVLAAIKGTGGIVQTVALALQCDWHTARRYIDRWKQTREAFVGEANELLDMAESKLIEAMERGEPWAIKLLLMTKGKRRGYSLRFEHTAEDGSPIQARFIAPKRFVNAKDWQQFAQECQRARLTSKEEKSAEEDN